MRIRRLLESEAAATAGRDAVSMASTFDDALMERWRERIAQGTVWGLERGGSVLGHCRLLPSEHLFGGRAVPTLDIAAVAVPPEHRGQGVARAMMEAAVAYGTEQGFGLSLLFPATTAMYRKLGWEHAGSWSRYRVPTAAVPGLGPVMRVGDAEGDWEAIRACRERSVRALSGPAVRSEERWDALGRAPYRFVLDAPEPGTVLEAYALVRQRTTPGDWRHVVVLEDWAATSRQGLEAVAGLIGRWSTFGSAAELVDTVPSRLSGVIPEQSLERAGGLHWMARGLDLEVAVSARGFPRGLTATVGLEVDGAEGAWRLEVADGRGRLTRTDHGQAWLHTQALGPLFTGFRSPAELVLQGLARGPTEALELLGAAFSGPPPVVFDFF